MTRWVVLHEHTFTDGDAAGTGIDDATVERWIADVRDAYLAQCGVLGRLAAEPGLEWEFRPGPVPPGALLGRPEGVAVSASVKEFRPSSFTLSVRLRPWGGDVETPVNATCVVRVREAATGAARELGDEIRDELIGLEQGARHAN